jgi:hypothetical protein
VPIVAVSHELQGCGKSEGGNPAWVVVERHILGETNEKSMSTYSFLNISTNIQVMSGRFSRSLYVGSSTEYFFFFPSPGPGCLVTCSG